MPIDVSLDETPSARHGNAARPYPCHAWEKPPAAAWSIDHGYCRTSLDALIGSTDPRCPTDCLHKAPHSVVVRFEKQFQWRGAAMAAAWAKGQQRKKK